MLFKTSALFLLQRLFPGRGFRLTLWAIGSFVLAYSLTQILGILLTCIPINAIWDPSVDGRCIDTIDVYLVCSSFNIATDVLILALPITKLWNLQISTSQKGQLCAFFALGGS